MDFYQTCMEDKSQLRIRTDPDKGNDHFSHFLQHCEIGCLLKKVKEAIWWKKKFVTLILVLFQVELLKVAGCCSPLHMSFCLLLPWSPVCLHSQRSLPVLSTLPRASSWPATWSTQSSRSSTKIVMINSATRSSSASWRTGCTALTGWDSSI